MTTARPPSFAMAAKRADYFRAGALVVWDVDVLRERLVRVYRASDRQRRPSIDVASVPMPNLRSRLDDVGGRSVPAGVNADER